MTARGLRLSGGPDWPVAHLSGDLDLANVEQVKVAVEGAVSNRAHGLVLDLSAVTFMDSTGLRLVFELARRLDERQQRLKLVVPPGARPTRVLELAAVESVAEVLPALPQLEVEPA